MIQYPLRLLILFSATLFFIAACSSVNRSYTRTTKHYFPGYAHLSNEDRKRSDSLLRVGLDQEALYTLAGRLKPISSLGYSLAYPLAKDSTHQDGDRSVVHVERDSVYGKLQELEAWHRIAKALSGNDLTFLVIPFREPYRGKRHLELLVCRNSVVDSILRVHQEFFGQWGFTPGTDPHTLLTAIEFESRGDRFRAYGYLFGYPQHAVDFFVQADKDYKRTGEFVKRDFFHIPTYARPDGHFTYAVPKGYIPTSTDSALYHRGLKILNQYRMSRDTTSSPVDYLRSITQ